MRTAVRSGRFAVIAVLSVAGVALAGRPLAVDDADPVDRGRLELEAGVVYEKTSDCRHWDQPVGLAYGVWAGLEVAVGFGGQMERREYLREDCGETATEHKSGLGDLTLSAKWRFLPCGPLGERQAFVPTVKLPTADEDEELGSGETDGDLMWIVSWALSESGGLHANLGYTWVGGADADLLHYGLALEYVVTEAVQWVGEVWAERELQSAAQPAVQANVGIRWNLREDLTLDAAAGTRLSREAPHFTATAGLTWTFGPDRSSRQ